MNEKQEALSGATNLPVGFKNIFFVINSLNRNNTYIISDSVKEITGYSPEEIKALPDQIYSLIYEDDSEFVKKQFVHLENDIAKSCAELSYRITAKNGELVWLNECVSVVRKTDSGKVLEKKSTFCNVTKIKTEEAELNDAVAALKDLNSAKDKFISIISHDLRAPFTTLLGFSEILLNESDISEDEKTEYLRYIYDASKSQLDLINCLLDWSRLQTGRIKIEPVRLNVKSVISNVIAPLTGNAVRKNIDVRIDIPIDLNINADERLIGQAVLNLTSNAIKYTPEGKEVHLSSSRFKEGMIEIIVRDEGLGISEENQSKLFRIDQKFSLVGTGGEKGSGLGLTLVKEIVEKHNGQVWFYSKVGEGSEFHFTVPEAKNLVMIVEDDHGVRAWYKKIIELTLPNFEVKFADNGYEAINVYRELLPTIIITDHDMPLMNGIQLIEAIHKKEMNKTVPIIVISAKLNDDVIRKYTKLGVDKIVAKPVDQEQLIQMIRECLY
jgi:PAS domain S-box-containing protein